MISSHQHSMARFKNCVLFGVVWPASVSGVFLRNLEHSIFPVYFALSYLYFNWWLYSKIRVWIYFFLDYDRPSSVPVCLILCAVTVASFSEGTALAGYITRNMPWKKLGCAKASSWRNTRHFSASGAERSLPSNGRHQLLHHSWRLARGFYLKTWSHEASHCHRSCFTFDLVLCKIGTWFQKLEENKQPIIGK